MKQISKSQKTLRVAVVGAGKMGQHHLRIYRMLRDAHLVGVVDVDKKRAEQAAKQYQCEAFTHIEDLIGKVDAVSIAVPSRLHAKIGEFFLSQGIHCLIEKPLAMTEKECLKLIKTAEKKGVILLVGHVESFNPALQTMKKILSNANHIYAIEAKRMGWNPNRLLGFDVILDLMVHDVEIIQQIIEEKVLSVASFGIKNKNVPIYEHAYASLLFENNAVANLTASWIAPKKMRSLEVISDIGHFCLDYTAQKLSFYPDPGSQSLMQEYTCDEKMETILVRYQEPLMLELQNFLQSIESGVHHGVNGYQALSALKLCWTIQQQLSESMLEREKSYV